MTLTRYAQGSATVAHSASVTGTYARSRVDYLRVGVEQGDMTVEIMADELAAAGWPDHPKNKDRITFADGRTMTLFDADGVYEGATLIGWRLFCRGNS